MARALHERLGWDLDAQFDASKRADILYLSAYFEARRLRPWPTGGAAVVAYFTHREEEPPNNAKAREYDRVAKQVDLRIATCRMYADGLSKVGPTAQVHPPVERERFTVPKHSGGRRRLVAGFSGYTYANHRKGEDLVGRLLASNPGRSVEWKASGRGWPVPTRKYTWAAMPSFYQSLDVLVCTSRVEGVPMPPLEALACGVSVVVPRGVGLLDELPDTLGIHRYRRGDAASLVAALEAAIQARSQVDREALRAATAPYSVQAWCDDHERAFSQLTGGIDAGIIESERPAEKPATLHEVNTEGPVAKGTGSKRGIYCVAFGDPARKAALRMMQSAKQHMPDVPIALCAARKIGPEDVLIIKPDSDIGGRRAKLQAYENSPAEWEAVLYLDADTEVVAPIHRFFEWIEDGWEFVICKDPHLMDTMHSFERRNNRRELAAVQEAVHTLHTLQYNGGVWAFGRNERIARFFRRWQAEWEVHAQRDQGALIRAMYTEPLKVWLLGNEWNTFEKYSKGVQTAGLMHYPGDARRWTGMIDGRIDSPQAWAAVKRFENEKLGKRR
jgi:hypothetical protein